YNLCNIFCCNCDGGCDSRCEQTTCNAKEWSKCLVAAVTCGISCVTNGAACATCLASVGASFCKECYFQLYD
ncbi:3501_t:CDS:1, partial [Dentiscutata heterogama]